MGILFTKLVTVAYTETERDKGLGVIYRVGGASPRVGQSGAAA